MIMSQPLFNAITFTGDKTIGAEGFVKYRKISSIDRHVNFISRKYPDWRFITFYNKATNEKTIITKKGLSNLLESPPKNDKHFSLGQ